MSLAMCTAVTLWPNGVGKAETRRVAVQDALAPRPHPPQSLERYDILSRRTTALSSSDIIAPYALAEACRKDMGEMH